MAAARGAGDARGGPALPPCRISPKIQDGSRAGDLGVRHTENPVLSSVCEFYYLKHVKNEKLQTGTEFE